MGDAATDPTATLDRFTLDDLAEFKREQAFPPGDSSDMRLFFVGRDDVHAVLLYLLSRVARSLKFNQYGYDDAVLDQTIRSLIEDSHVYVQGTLDATQGGGKHEKAITSTWSAAVRASFAFVRTPTGQIAHTKGGVLDGVVGFEGSTNWSAAGEGIGIGIGGEPNAPGYKAQYNTLTVFTHPVQVRAFAQQLDEEHTEGLQRQLSTLRGNLAAVTA